MRELVYANTRFSADSRSADLKKSTDLYEELYINGDATETQVTRRKERSTPSEPNISGHSCYTAAVVCLLMLVVLLLAAVAILWVNLTTKGDQLQTSYSNITAQRDQLEAIYNTLTAEKDQLETVYIKVAEERIQFQRKTDELQKKLFQLKTDINLPGWRYFSSSVYYTSTEKKSWSESREDCRGKESDLVIINSREEQDFVEVFRRGEVAWIGANDRDTEGVWKWVNGTQVTNGFWNEGEPNDIDDEDCAVFGYGSNPTNWIDVSYNGQYIWICEKRIIG